MSTKTSRKRKLGAKATVVAIAAATGSLLAVHRQCQALRIRLEQHEESCAATHQHHINLANQQRLHWELLSKAMEDPDLAAVLDTYEERLSTTKHRQFLFANALYTNALLAYRIGNVTEAELFGYLRGSLQNPVFRDYWEAARPHRASLEPDSAEAQVGRMVDKLVRDLDEADTEEWWVVGEPPV
ncbi:hypothetical protein GR925_31440 [Streptomyces sp. HUCO-GS316]|uniref:DUF6082 family protein n=1 Tax=Streptomyces sp. HUCO-GS316 TaxID=2692198 RepID=UPI00136E072F|nr:DUF6082 family protein [Streptomyces sp. HUCO-GS316]MXM67827.1 hypothetical protein [Streptomyces sp. HUCO-GS316]